MNRNEILVTRDVKSFPKAMASLFTIFLILPFFQLPYYPEYIVAGLCPITSISSNSPHVISFLDMSNGATSS